VDFTELHSVTIHITNFNTHLILLLDQLGPLACSHSELIWNYKSYIQFIGLHGWGMSPYTPTLEIFGNKMWRYSGIIKK
jgi:hypothetical protein